MSSIKTIEKTVVAVILRPEMYGADNIKSLEVVIVLLLNLREEILQKNFPDMWFTSTTTISRAWTKEYFGTSGPRASCFRLEEKFGWRSGDTNRDHRDTWLEAVDYYKEFASRVFRASGTEVAFEWDDSE